MSCNFFFTNVKLFEFLKKFNMVMVKKVSFQIIQNVLTMDSTLRDFFKEGGEFP